MNLAGRAADLNDMSFHGRARRQNQPVIKVKRINGARFNAHAPTHAHVMANLDFDQGAAFQGGRAGGMGMRPGGDLEQKTGC
jgi:hypothetical protein